VSVTVSRRADVVGITAEEAERFLATLPPAGADHVMDRSAVARLLTFAEGAALALTSAKVIHTVALSAALKGAVARTRKYERAAHEHALHHAAAAVLRVYAEHVRLNPSSEPLHVHLEALAQMLEEEAGPRKVGR
jgi:uncharacterized protein (DUF2267 family)